MIPSVLRTLPRVPAGVPDEDSGSQDRTQHLQSQSSWCRPKCLLAFNLFKLVSKQDLPTDLTLRLPSAWWEKPVVLPWSTAWTGPTVLTRTAPRAQAPSAQLLLPAPVAVRPPSSSCGSRGQAPATHAASVPGRERGRAPLPSASWPVVAQGGPAPACSRLPVGSVRLPCAQAEVPSVGSSRPEGYFGHMQGLQVGLPLATRSHRGACQGLYRPHPGVGTVTAECPRRSERACVRREGRPRGPPPAAGCPTVSPPAVCSTSGGALLVIIFLVCISKCRRLSVNSKLPVSRQ